MAREIELKLSVDAGQASRVWQVLAGHPHRNPVTRPLFSAYYDTPDRRLAAKGIALRLRREGKRWVQTLKSGGETAGGLHKREEHDTEVAAQLISFPALVDAGLGNLISARGVRDAIAVVFTTEFNRTCAQVPAGAGNTVEVSVDRGSIIAGGRREAISEIELELKTGDPGCLFDLALEIARHLPVRLENRSKAERGYALAAGTRRGPVKAAPSGLVPGSTVDDALAALAFQCLQQLQANERGLLESRDPEYLHQARVALRRLRSVFRVFAATGAKTECASLLEEIKRLGRRLGAARNWDVLAGGILADAAAGAGEPPAMASLTRRAQAQRRAARQAARAAVMAPGYTALMIRLAAMLEMRRWMHGAARLPQLPSLQTYARETLARLHARVLKRGRRLDTLAFEDLHRLRIDVKRLRYAEEFFLTLAPKKKQAMPGALANVQERLGQINDAANAWALLDTLAASDPSPDYQQAVGFVRGWAMREARQVRQSLAKDWREFERQRTWW